MQNRWNLELAAVASRLGVGFHSDHVEMTTSNNLLLNYTCNLLELRIADCKSNTDIYIIKYRGQTTYLIRGNSGLLLESRLCLTISR